MPRIDTYRGFGTATAVCLPGRIVREPAFGRSLPKGSLRRQLAGILRRALRRGVPNARLVARLGDETLETRADRLGYFCFEATLARPLARDGWHSLGVAAPDHEIPSADGEIFVPPEGARRVVISDIDDTIMVTGVVNKVVMLWRLFMRRAESRVAFPGIAALCRALHAGSSGEEGNVMLYVSRGPWSLYATIARFFALHEIPVGPILFLRDWGLHLQHPLPRRARDHKIALIRRMIAFYAPLPFVLIGDSGQHDPEIYARVVHEHPGRVEAIYIRNVSRDPERRRAIEALAEEVVAARSTLLLAADTFAMADHAASHGLIAAEALAAVMADKRRDEAPEVHPTVHLTGGATVPADAASDPGPERNIDIDSGTDRNPLP